jgi:hypothetical protein
MAFTFAIVLLSVLVLALLGGTITIIVIWFKNKPTVPTNAPLGINFAPEFTNGYSIFQEISVKKFPNGRTLSKLMPKDINQDEGLSNLEKPKPVFLVCAPGCRIATPSGDLSSSRTVIFYMPPTSEQLNNSFKKTTLGKAMTDSIEFEQICNMLDEKVKKIREYVSKVGNKGEEVMSKIVLDNLDEIAEKMHQVYNKVDNKKTENRGYNPMGMPPY